MASNKLRQLCVCADQRMRCSALSMTQVCAFRLTTILPQLQKEASYKYNYGQNRLGKACGGAYHYPGFGSASNSVCCGVACRLAGCFRFLLAQYLALNSIFVTPLWKGAGVAPRAQQAVRGRPCEQQPIGGETLQMGARCGRREAAAGRPHRVLASPRHHPV